MELLWLMPLLLLPVAINRLAPYPSAADHRLLLHVFGATAAAVLALDAIAWVWRRIAAPPGSSGSAASDADAPGRHSPGALKAFRAVLVAGGVLMAVRCLTALSGLCPADSFIGLPTRDGGLFSQLACAAILLAAVIHVREQAQVERILVAAFLGSLAPIAVGTMQIFRVRVFTPDAGFPEGRIWSTFGNAILFGSYLAGVLPATLWTAWRAARSSRLRLLAAVPAVCVALDVWLLLRTGSRGPLLAAMSSGCLGLVFILRRAGARNAAKALSCAIALGIALLIGGVQLVAKSDSVQSMRRRGMVTRYNTVEVRLMLYDAMTRNVLHPGEESPDAVFRDPLARWRPWIGYGTDCLTYPLLRAIRTKLELAEGAFRMPDSTHSATMDALGGGGLIGLAALVALLGAVLAAMARAERLGEAEDAQPQDGAAAQQVGGANADTAATAPATPPRRRLLAAALPPAGALAGAVGMVMLWGGHTWAIGALAGGYVGVLAAIAALMRRNVPADPPAHLPDASELLAVTGFCMVAAIWIDAQFGLWAASSALLLHVGLALILLCCKARISHPQLATPTPQPAPSPFGIWCVVALVLTLGWFWASWTVKFPTETLPSLHTTKAFGAWLEKGVQSWWLSHGTLAAVLAVAVLGTCFVQLFRGDPRKFLAGLAGVMLPCLACVVALRSEWHAVAQDMRFAGAGFIANGGLPSVALKLCSSTAPSLTAHNAWLQGQKRRVWLVKEARKTNTVDRAAAWDSALKMADDCAAVRPFDATVVRAAADVCLSAASADAGRAALWNERAIPRYRATLALVPGSNILRQRLARVVYDAHGGDSPALRAVFDDMLAADPENPVAHSMLAQFAKNAMEKETDPAARLAHADEVVRRARRTLASPSLRLSRVNAASVRANLQAALAEFRRQRATPPPAPPAARPAPPLEEPHLPASRRRLAGAFCGAALAALVSFLLVPPVRRLARWAGWLDAPAARKVHREPTPLLGGLAIIAGLWTASLALPAVPLSRPFGAVLGIATALAAIGVVDDRHPLRWQIKLGAQFAAAAALYAVGVRVRLAWLPTAANVALTVFWLVGVTNAVNFLDNMNGLSNGLAAWSAAAIAAIGLVCGEWGVAAAALALAGACAGFLRGNNPWRGSIFMGDTGSLFLGLSLACLALLLRFPNNANWVTWLCPVLLLAVPVFDMSHVCLARLRRGRNPFSTPGKDHTSHLFERMGLSRPTAVLAVHFLVVLCAVATWIVSFSSPIVAYAVAGAVLAGAVFLLVYFELRFGIGGSDEYRDAR